MGKIIRLKESELIHIIRDIISEVESFTGDTESLKNLNLSPISLDLSKLQKNDLSILNPGSVTIKNNQTLINQLSLKNIIDPKKISYSTNDKDFLSKLTKDLKDAGFRPYLKLRRNFEGPIPTPGFIFTVPQAGFEMQLDRYYFGFSERPPFLRNVQIMGSYQPLQKMYRAGLKINI
jgi:hypothetical protein